MIEMATQGMTDEEFHWTPPGTANTISAILLHVYGIEDTILQRLCQGQQAVWARDSWAERVGVAATPGHAGGWSEPAEARISLDAVRDYGRAVQAATEAYIAALSDTELQREIELRGKPGQIADALILAASHTGLHAGEISTLRGAQGAQGWPF
jgi:uncharacterized damage-inducible protein DinB